jgi:hypothetical protein
MEQIASLEHLALVFLGIAFVASWGLELFLPGV